MGYNRQESEQFLEAGMQPLPVLFVEGALAPEFTGYPLLQSLNAEGYPVFLLNQLFPVNFGFGVKNAVARRVHEINRDHNGPVAIVGHSIGAKYALETLEEHPDEVAGVIAVAGVVNDPLHFVTRPWFGRNHYTETDIPQERQTVGVATPGDLVLPPLITRNNQLTEQKVVWSWLLPPPIAHQAIIFDPMTHLFIKDKLREMTINVRSMQTAQSHAVVARTI